MQLKVLKRIIQITIICFVFVACSAGKTIPSENKGCKKAHRWHKRALRLEARSNYYKAEIFYDKSLDRCYIDSVYDDYKRLMSAIGPM